MGLIFIVELLLVVFGESDLNPLRQAGHPHGPLLGVKSGGVKDGLVYYY